MTITEILVSVADMHINSKVGLCPPYIELDLGSYRPSKAQLGVWRSWLDYWRQIEEIKNKLNATLFVNILGDVMDKPTHKNSNYHTITPNESVILETARVVLEPATKLADHLLFCRGTEAHAGGAGHLEVELARDLGAEERDGSPAPWGWLVEIGGVTFDLYHHPATSGRLEDTRGPAAARLAKRIQYDYTKTNRKPPDVAVRAHVHYFAVSGRTASVKLELWQCPSWQLTPAYGYRFGSGEIIEPVGGLYFIPDNGKPNGQEILYRGPRSKPWKPSQKKT